MLLYNLITHRVKLTTFKIILFLFELKPLVPMGSNFMEKNHLHNSFKNYPYSHMGVIKSESL